MKKLLFVCIENACRSQMAEGFANHFGKGILESYSAGSKPSGKVNSKTIIVMKEAGIDISFAKSKGFDELLLKKFDYVITLGCKDICSFIPAHKHIEWQIEDPKGKNMEFFRKVRNLIEEKVKELVKDIG